MNLAFTGGLRRKQAPAPLSEIPIHQFIGFGIILVQHTDNPGPPGREGPRTGPQAHLPDGPVFPHVLEYKLPIRIIFPDHPDQGRIEIGLISVSGSKNSPSGKTSGLPVHF